MTVAYKPSNEWRLEALRDNTLQLLADEFDNINQLQEKYLAVDYMSEEASFLAAELHVARSKALGLAQIAARQHRLAESS